MSVKKTLLLCAASAAVVSMTAAMAGGFTQEPTAATADNGYYIEGHLGYARQNYNDNLQYHTSAFLANNSNTTGGFAAGVDTGYKINRHFAVELGWFHLPDVNTVTSTSPAQYLTSWVLYLAGKYMMPLPMMNNTDVFFKLGVGYRQANITATQKTSFAVSTTSDNYVRPMFATGLDYSFSDSWSGIFQYAYFMGSQNSFPYTATSRSALGTVAANVFTLGLGYKFTI
ncbi:MAG: outer membrane beta-barrel protein [Gammaproteobacteria bacterium]|nr:outer membrane beta-barrel protein [Gammaproteobacteria bacterium]